MVASKAHDSDSERNGNLELHDKTMPIGIGFLLWGMPFEETMLLMSDEENWVAAIWLFAPRDPEDFAKWSDGIRRATGSRTKIWIQVGTVAEALHAAETAEPDVLVVQGQDAGGHGLTKGAGLIPLLPETIEAVTTLVKEKGKRLPKFVATGGIMEGSGVAGALALGAHGVTLGTRYLAAEESLTPPGYQQAVLRAKDGGASTVRSHVYDSLRGTTDWPKQYGGRGVINASYEDYEKGVNLEENKKLYDAALEKGAEGWDEKAGRLTTYAGTGVGLVKKVQRAGEITTEVREDGLARLKEVAAIATRL